MKNFIMIPSDFINNSNLTKTDCFLFDHIYSLSRKEGYCYSTNQKLIEQSFIKTRTLNYSLKRLEENGYIKIVKVKYKGSFKEEFILLIKCKVILFKKQSIAKI